MRKRQLAAWQLVLLALLFQGLHASPPPLGAWLGCFAAGDVLPHVHLRKAYTRNSLASCRPACRARGYTLIVVTADLRCGCSLTIPAETSALPAEHCELLLRRSSSNSSAAAAVLYDHKAAATQRCRLAPIVLARPDDIDIHYNAHNVAFDAGTMTLRMDGSSGTRVVARGSSQMYGQVQVAARVSGEPGAVTAFYARDSDAYNWDNSGDFEEIDVEWLNGQPSPVPGSVWLNVYHNGMSGGERLVPPSEYTRLPGMGMRPGDRTYSRFNTYTFNWQPSHVSWGMNGVPLLTRTTGEHVRWRDMHGKLMKRTFYSPDRPMHLSFSLWTDYGSGHSFGGVLNRSASPFLSSFRALRRIVCEPANGTDSSSGPAWLHTLPGRTGHNSSWVAVMAPAHRPHAAGNGQAATPRRGSTPARPMPPSRTPASKQWRPPGSSVT